MNLEEYAYAIRMLAMRTSNDAFQATLHVPDSTYSDSHINGLTPAQALDRAMTAGDLPKPESSDDPDDAPRSVREGLRAHWLKAGGGRAMYRSPAFHGWAFYPGASPAGDIVIREANRGFTPDRPAAAYQRFLNAVPVPAQLPNRAERRSNLEGELERRWALHTLREAHAEYLRRNPGSRFSLYQFRSYRALGWAYLPAEDRVEKVAPVGFAGELAKGPDIKLRVAEPPSGSMKAYGDAASNGLGCPTFMFGEVVNGAIAAATLRPKQQAQAPKEARLNGSFTAAQLVAIAGRMNAGE